MKKKISPSLMCLTIDTTQDAIKLMEKEQVEYLHIDVMDGVFVPNIMLGTQYIQQIRSMTSIPLDLHLMIVNPEQKLDWFEIRKGDRVIFHIESTVQINKTIHIIKSRGGIPVVALNPETALSVLDYILKDIGGVLLMTVNPGFAGQEMVEGMPKKLEELQDYLRKKDRLDISIGVDGNVSFENARILSNKGADLFVAGSSSIFSKGIITQPEIKKFREAIGTSY
jgi:ribulose-phosphate 3-epimerase